jgi:hypothetical protein
MLAETRSSLKTTTPGLLETLGTQISMIMEKAIWMARGTTKGLGRLIDSLHRVTMEMCHLHQFMIIAAILGLTLGQVGLKRVKLLLLLLLLHRILRKMMILGVNN